MTTTIINFSTIKFAIPTYKRHDIIQERTLALLEKFKIPRKQIYIFVANQEEHELYTNTINCGTEKYKIILGEEKLFNQRNFITKYFKEKTKIINLDDDIKNLQILENSVLRDITLQEFKYYICKAFKLCIEHKAYIWGIHQTSNPYFMRDSITFDFSFIVGFFWGCINRHLPELTISMDIKEDYERTVKYWLLDKTVVKINNLCANTNVYMTKGGLQADYPDRTQASINSCIDLAEKYTGFFSIRNNYLNNHQSSRYWELKLVRGHISPNNYYIEVDCINQDCNIVKSILDILKNKPLEINKKRLNSGIGISQSFGLIKRRKQKGLHSSQNNNIYPQLYKLLLDYGNKYVIQHKPAYTSIQVNVNYESKPHIDKNNVGNSYIVGIDNYTGGELLLNSYRHNIKYMPLLFNGKRYMHSTRPFIGNRISLIYFTLN